MLLIFHTNLAPGWLLIQVNFDPIQEIRPKVGSGGSFVSECSFARLEYMHKNTLDDGDKPKAHYKYAQTLALGVYTREKYLCRVKEGAGHLLEGGVLLGVYCTYVSVLSRIFWSAESFGLADQPSWKIGLPFSKFGPHMVQAQVRTWSDHKSVL